MANTTTSMSVDLAATLAPRDAAFVAEAVDYLEHPGFLLRAANLLGRPLEAVQKVLPARVRQTAALVVERALRTALQAALLTLPAEKGVRNLFSPPKKRFLTPFSAWGHSLAVGLTGAVGGAFGLPALAFELPITTTLLLRNIASVAQDLGEDLDDAEARLHCLAVFSLGGARDQHGKLEAMESSYYATRVALSRTVQDAAAYAARVTGQQLARDLAAGGSPVLVRLVAQVASRFNVAVHEKLLAQAVPALGAAGGAVVNVAFQRHFHRLAGYHFGLRALERRHGRELVQAQYQRMLSRHGDLPESST